jgi:hypothetical protein
MAGASRNMSKVSEYNNKLLIDVNGVILWWLQEPPYLPNLNILGKHQSSLTEG